MNSAKKVEQKNMKDNISYEKVGTVGGNIIGVDIGMDYFYKYNPWNGETPEDILLNAGMYLAISLLSGMVGGTIGKLMGKRIDRARSKLQTKK